MVTSGIITYGQTTSKVRKVVKLLDEQTIYLNSTSNGALAGGKSRVNYKIDLPANTIKWYYIFSTSPNEGKNQTLSLMAHLSRVIDPTGISAVTLDALATPSGSGGIIDIFIMGYENRTAFMSKDNWGAWEYNDPGGYEEGRTLNARQGKKSIDDVLSGTVFFGIKNPHAKDGVNVTFEAVAIVEEETIFKTTSSNTQMVFDQTTYNYGNISKGSNGTHKFNFTNKGGQALVINSIVSTSRSISGTPSQEVIQPNVNGFIEVSYDTNRIGIINKQIEVQTNAGNFILKIKGQVN